MMPTLETSGLIAAYVALAVLLLAMLLYARWHWLAKAAAILLVSAFYYVTYLSLPQLLGWPTTRDLPQRFHLIAVFVDAPHAVHLWGSDLSRGVGPKVPRAYTLPYSRSLHDQADAAGRRLRRGFPLIGELSTAISAGSGAAGGEPREADRLELKVIDVPEALVPRK